MRELIDGLIGDINAQIEAIRADRTAKIDALLVRKRALQDAKALITNQFETILVELKRLGLIGGE